MKHHGKKRNRSGRWQARVKGLTEQEREEEFKRVRRNATFLMPLYQDIKVGYSSPLVAATIFRLGWGRRNIIGILCTRSATWRRRKS